MMESFTKPTHLNGVQLVDEINNQNIKVTGVPMIDADGVLWLDIDANDQNKVATIVQNHQGQDNTKAEAITKAIARTVLLARLGITEEEAELLK